jgi:hypothetical protein
MIAGNQNVVPKTRAQMAVRRSSLSRKPAVQPLNDRRKSAVCKTKSSLPAATMHPARKVATVVGPQVSTPHSHRGKTATRTIIAMPTPSFSCIPRRKTVAFLTPTSAKRTPKPQHTPGLTEEMCLRYIDHDVCEQRNLHV